MYRLNENIIYFEIFDDYIMVMNLETGYTIKINKAVFDDLSSDCSKLEEQSERDSDLLKLLEKKGIIYE
ncbi:MAG: hypothetical protein Q4Q07_09255 [Tissierellia bacterium]|nr:hypothetical protein [Tissierellia bacterium]